ncbi:MAG: flagellar FliJ family protein [Kiloniellales bacterium]
MTVLSTLIRVHRWALEEKQRKLADLEALIERLRGDLMRLEEEIVAEQATAPQSFVATTAYPAFLAAALERKRRLTLSIANIAASLEAARDELAEAFREVKSYELAAKNQDQRRKTRRSKREQVALDEIGLEGHRRKRRDA